MSEDIVELIDDLSAAALDCKWRPFSRSEYEDTLAIAHAIVTAFLADGSPRNSPFEHLPLSLLRKIFEMAIAAQGNRTRRALEDVSRFFRSIVFTSNELWDDVTTYPQYGPHFVNALVRSRLGGYPPTLLCDEANHHLSGHPDSSIPDSFLLYTCLPDCADIIITHSSRFMSIVTALKGIPVLPALQRLIVYSSTAFQIEVPPDRLRSWFPKGIATVSLPEVQILHLLNCPIAVRDVTRLTDLRLRCCYPLPADLAMLGHESGLQSDDPDDSDDTEILHPASASGDETSPAEDLTGRWTPFALGGLLASNPGLTRLHLANAIRTEDNTFPSDLVHLRSLRELIVSQPNAEEVMWLIDTLRMPDSVYMCLRIGHGAHDSPLDISGLAQSLKVHFRGRKFRHMIALPSDGFSGVLFSLDERTLIPLEMDDRRVWAITEDASDHVFYRGSPGAIDIYVCWPAVWAGPFHRWYTRRTYWHDVYDAVRPYLGLEYLSTLEVNPESDQHADVTFDREGLPRAYPEFTELRIRREDLNVRLVVYVARLFDTDCEDAPSKRNIRRVVRAIASVLPSLRQITDVPVHTHWEGSTLRSLVASLAHAL